MINECTKSETEMELLKLGEKESFEFNLPAVEFNELFYKIRFKDFFSENSKVLFLWKQGIPVAYIALGLARGNEYANVSSIFVLKTHRRQGHAKELIQYVLNIDSIQKLTLQAYPHNEASLKLYKKLGFRIIRYEMEFRNDM